MIFALFEVSSSGFDTFVIYQFASGMFQTKATKNVLLISFLLSFLGLVGINMLINNSVVNICYSIICTFLILTICYISTIPRRTIAVLYFIALMAGAEAVCSILITKFWHTNISATLQYGALRVISIASAKIIQLFLVKISVIVKNRYVSKTHDSRYEYKMLIPFLICQIISIIILHTTFVAYGERYVSALITPEVLFSIIGIMYFNVIVFWYFDRLRNLFDYQNQIESSKVKIELQKRYLDLISDRQKDTDAIWHDITKHIKVIKSLLASGNKTDAENYINELTDNLKQTTQVVRTRYPVLSALLTEQKIRAKNLGVAFNLELLLESNINISPVDLCVVLGNLFDNAFDACVSITDEDPYVTAEIISKSKMVLIKISNNYNANHSKHSDDGKKHGIGMNNVKSIIRKYDGKLTVDKNGSTYVVDILIP